MDNFFSNKRALIIIDICQCLLKCFFIIRVPNKESNRKLTAYIIKCIGRHYKIPSELSFEAYPKLFEVRRLKKL